MGVTEKFDLVPNSSFLVSVLLVAASCITACTLGFDGSMMNGLNILPSYTDYFHLTTATTALNTSAVWLGGCLSGLLYGYVVDAIGRKPALLYGALFTVFAAVIQAAAQNTAMFVVARILIGIGTGASGVAGPVYLAETLPPKWRAWGLGVFYDCWYVGGLIAAGVTYGTAKMQSTWAWRLPSALQGLFSIICIVVLPFIPESPRWLIYKGRNEEALQVIAQTNCDGDASNPVVLVQYKEMVDTIEFEKNSGETMSFLEIVKTPSARKRTLLAVSVAVFTMLSGNNIISYYLGTMLDNAGITNSTTQLEINVILNAWCLVIAIIGTYFVDHFGRKTMAIWSTVCLIFFIFIIGGLTKEYGNTSFTPGVYGTVAAIFLFQGSYSFGWTPLSVLYPPEVLNYSIRANGLAFYTFMANGCGLLVTFAFPFALDAISWKTYMINGAWDVLELVFVLYYWVETKDKTLEEIDELLDGSKHSQAPDLEAVMAGKAELGDCIVGVEPVVEVSVEAGKQ
ncbi:MFS sugar transporter-like protein [Coleophoma cylindrospora]|uniref:MFS sugar transporter-like protein n=1 Tax=Coleophoma cylindrospora TaxID=1849047 RepID=A0A3D8Q724_9HELO|nr:MFS sugar transporter-like protein [Coleophoma cylindrospora]